MCASSLPIKDHMHAALVQMTSSDDPAANAQVAQKLVEQAAQEGAQFVLTPEVSNMISWSRSHQRSVLSQEANDPMLAALRETAAKHGVWVQIGSLALLPDQNTAEGRFHNRAIMISDTGEIVARYDKIHMFDVDLANGESYRESAAYEPGNEAVIAQTPWGGIGMTICYDMRFPALHRSLAENGARIITSPAAFTVPTGAAHWHVLLRARAIETGCFVLAAAQVGKHQAMLADTGRARETYGHSLAIDPWGKIIAEASGVENSGPASVTHVELDLSKVERTRSKVPSLSNARPFTIQR